MAYPGKLVAKLASPLTAQRNRRLTVEVDTRQYILGINFGVGGKIS